MEYFSEIYGEYYRAVAAVLSCALRSPLTEKEIYEIIRLNAFEESALYIAPKLISGEWPLLKQENGLFCPVVRHETKMPVTSLQKAWIMSILDDERCGAFFDEKEKDEIKAAIEYPSLYDNNIIAVVDACSDGDNYSDTSYCSNFRMILKAIREKEILRILYTSGKGTRVWGSYLPCRLEYSGRDDKMRLHAVKLRSGKAVFASTINLGRIEKVIASGEFCESEIDIESIARKNSHPETAVIELTDRRNALERFMVQFASYDKHTRHDRDTDKYICSISYNSSDETELLIRLLSFGPVIRVLSPDNLVSQMRQRINRQFELMGM